MRLRNLRLLVAAITIPLIASVAILISTANSAEGEAQSEPASTKPIAVASSTKRPDHYKRRTVRFQPWARPSGQQVHRIIAIEARRWKIPAYRLHSRISCESGYRWWAGNGQYVGLGQFAASTFYRGMSSIRTRKVVIKRSRVVRRPTVVITRWSDGRTTRKRGRSVKVRRTRIYKGYIPRSPSVTHGWAQVRIMAQAIRGISAVSNGEWSCS